MNYLKHFLNKKNPNSNAYNHNDYGESFTLSDDRAKLLPSFGSLRALNKFNTRDQNPTQKPNDNCGGVLSERTERSSGSVYTTLDTSERSFRKRDRRDGRDRVHGGGSEKEQQYGDDDDDDESERDFCVANVPVDGFGRRSRRKENTQYRFLEHCVTLLGYIFVISFTIMIIIVPILLRNQPKSEWCRIYQHNNNHCSSDNTTTTSSTSSQTFQTNNQNHNNCTDTATNNHNFESPTFPSQTAEYENPNFDTDPCRYIRIPHLFYLTLEEADHCCRLLASVIMGFAIGYERRISDRPAGIRTMGLVSLGSCFFTIGSIAAFRSSTMGWDASRVSAAIPSGVGFLGAGLIWKGNVGEGPNANHQVHGLTTAASVWLSAAAGVGVGGRLYFVSGYSMILIMIILRYGPTISHYFDTNNEYDDSNDEYDNYSEDVLSKSGRGSNSNDLDSTDELHRRRRRSSRMNRRQGHSKNLDRNVERRNNRSFDSCSVSSNRKVTESNNNVEHLQNGDCTDNYYKINAEEMIMFQRWKESQMTQSSANDTKLPRNSPSCGDGNNVVESPDKSDSWKNSREIDRNNNDDTCSNHQNNRNGRSLTGARDFMKVASIASEEIGSEYMETQVPIRGNNDSDKGNNTSFYSSNPSSFDSTYSRASDLSYEST